MDANRKPRMTRQMVMRLSNRGLGSVDGFKTYGTTGRSLKANRQVNSDRRYVKNYRSSMAVNNVGNIRRFGSEIGIAPHSNNSGNDAKFPEKYQRSNRANLSENRESVGPGNSRQSFNATNSQPVFREPPSRGYNPFG